MRNAFGLMTGEFRAMEKRQDGRKWHLVAGISGSEVQEQQFSEMWEAIPEWTL
jgi:photosystem II stability/assembly factor-like uncharacterized protein